MLPIETQTEAEPMSEYDNELTQASSIPLEHFTINEHNLSDGDFDKLLLSGRFHEWKSYAALNASSIDEQNLQ
jgi:hypothetical protein